MNTNNDQKQDGDNGTSSTLVAAAVQQVAPKPSFDIGAARLSQDFGAMIGVKKLRTTVPVRKPTKTDYFRVNPDKRYRMVVAILENKEEREVFLLSEPVAVLCPGEWQLRELVVTTNRQGVVFIWPVPLPIG